MTQRHITNWPFKYKLKYLLQITNLNFWREIEKYRNPKDNKNMALTVYKPTKDVLALPDHIGIDKRNTYK